MNQQNLFKYTTQNLFKYQTESWRTPESFYYVSEEKEFKLPVQCIFFPRYMKIPFKMY